MDSFSIFSFVFCFSFTQDVLNVVNSFDLPESCDFSNTICLYSHVSDLMWLVLFFLWEVPSQFHSIWRSSNWSDSSSLKYWLFEFSFLEPTFVLQILSLFWGLTFNTTSRLVWSSHNHTWGHLSKRLLWKCDSYQVMNPLSLKPANDCVW